jgi:hypothetical protein
VAPSNSASITVQRPLHLAKFTLADEDGLKLILSPLIVINDGESWRKRPLLVTDAQNAFIAYADKAGKTHVAHVDLISGETKALPFDWPGAPVGLFTRGKDVVVVTTNGVYLGSTATALMATDTCAPIGATKVGADIYTLFCGTAAREILVKRMLLAQSDRTAAVSASATLLGNIDGIPAMAECLSSGTTAAIVVTDPDTKRSRLVNVSDTGRITYLPFESAVDQPAKIAVVSRESPLIAVSAGDEVKIFRSVRDRVESKGSWSFMDPDKRVAHVRGVRPLQLAGQSFVIVETQLLALRGMDVADGARNASRISMIPVD